MNEPTPDNVNSLPSRMPAEDKPNSLSLADRVQSLRLSDRPAPTRSRFGWLPWVLLILWLGSTGYLGVVSAQLSRLEDKLENLRQPSSPVKAGENPLISTPGRSAPAGEIALESKGYIVPVQQVQVSPKVGGVVWKLNFKEGDRVTKGFTLAELEDIDYKADRDRARKNLEAAKHRVYELSKYRKDEEAQVKADLDDTMAQLVQLDQDYKRNLTLRSSNAVALRDIEQAQSSFESMKQRVKRLELAYNLMKKGPRDERIAAAKAEVDMAEAELVKAQWRLNNCQVTAPMSGIILTKRTEEGSIVNPSAFSNGLAASLCDLADLTNMEVDLAIAERDIGKLFVGQKCKMRAEAFPQRIYEGAISRLMPTADRSKGAVPVRVKIDIPKEEEGVYLRPEMGAIVTFLSRK